MFHIGLTKDKKITTVASNSENALPVEFPPEEMYRYWFDEENNTIYPRAVVAYSLEEVDGKAVIKFDASKSFMVRIEVSTGEEGVDFAKEIFIENATIMDDETGEIIGHIKPELVFDCEVNAVIKFESASKDYCFEPFYVEASGLVDDDIPRIEYTMNNVKISMSRIQRELQELKKQLVKLGRGDLLE